MAEPLPAEGDVDAQGATYVCELHPVKDGAVSRPWGRSAQVRDFRVSLDGITREQINDPSFGATLALKGGSTAARVDEISIEIVYIISTQDAQARRDPIGDEPDPPHMRNTSGTAFFGIARSNTGVRVAVGDVGAIKRAEPGSNTFATVKVVNQTLLDVFWCETVFIAVGRNGAFWVSNADATEWFQLSAAVVFDLYGVAYNRFTRTLTIIGDSSGALNNRLREDQVL